MAADGQFGMYDYFAGNGYGYHHEDLRRTDRHLIINGPPFFVHKFLELKDILIIGLQAPHDYMTLLTARMRSRGEPPEVQAARQAYIQGDINDLEKLRATIKKHGKVFRIKNDHTVSDEVLPWIIQRLGIDRG